MKIKANKIIEWHSLGFIIYGNVKNHRKEKRLGIAHALLLTICKPTTDITSVDRKNIRQKVRGSLNSKIPITTVPIAPIAPQTAYAVPTGIAFSPPIALKSKYILILTEIRKAA